ncbi:MAG TPA: PepSY-associated TM helix domain-containing protein [Vicinamibacterales bacterium]|nr:PepSY-associated TM helix domain-containing protein [Vicinamibacterales bacterium]
MGFYRQPQTVWVRRAMFQIHLWTGIAVGLYVIVVCVTGSVLVFRRELTRKYANRPQIALRADVKPLEEDQLKAAAQRAFPDWRVDKVWRGRRANSPVDIWMTSGPAFKTKQAHLFEPYTGADLGETRPFGIRALDWLVSLHDDLLGGMNGRLVNGVGAILLTLLCLTGAIIWWPGAGKWRRGLLVRWRGGWQRINWDLHSALGFWTFIAVAGWAISAIYLVFPHPFSAVVDYLEPGDPFSRLPRRGDVALEWLAKLHFGRFAGAGTRWTWAILGVIPPVLFITGAVMWWNRVLSRTFSRRDSFNEQSVDRIRRRRADGRAHGLAAAGRGLRALRIRHER